MTTTKTASEKQNGRDAIALLTDDHKKVKKLFRDFEKLKQNGGSGDKAAIVRQACLELTIHAQIEEDIFYPAAKKVLDEKDLLNEAEVEHASAKELIAQLEGMEPGDELFDAKFIVLSEYVKHHIKEEEGELFPKVKDTRLDLEKVGVKLEQRKQELMDEMSAGADSDAMDMEEAEPALAEGDDEEDDATARAGKRKSAGSREKAGSYAKRARRSSQ